MAKAVSNDLKFVVCAAQYTKVVRCGHCVVTLVVTIVSTLYHLKHIFLQASQEFPDISLMQNHIRSGI